MKKILFSAAIYVVFAAMFMSPMVSADDAPLFTACKQAPSSAVCKSPGTKTNPSIDIIHVTTDIIAIITGAAAVVMIIISGIQMITSAGNSETVGNARRRLINALIGLAVVTLAWTIVTFLTDKLLA
jgi:hypothetical protein